MSQNLKPAQNCAGFIFCTFLAIVTAKKERGHTGVFMQFNFQRCCQFILDSIGEVHMDSHWVLVYSKTCVKRPLKKRQNKDLNKNRQLNEGLKYCRMLP